MKLTGEFFLFCLFAIANLGIIFLCIWELESLDLKNSASILKDENFHETTGKTDNVEVALSTRDLRGFPESHISIAIINSTKTDELGIVSSRMLNSIEFGSPLPNGKRTPLVMIRRRLEKHLHSRFLQDPMFSCNQTELDNFDGLEKRVKIPVYIYEGYFHSLPTADKFFSRNPNPKIAIDFMKPAAGSFIRAFYEAFRRINSAIFGKLTSDLANSALTRLPNHSERDICYQLSQWIERGYIFGDLSIQIHYGKGNDETFASAWHTDAVNSLLHLAVTLRGTRVLHSKRRNTTVGPVDEILEPITAGDVYLSSSALMLHAPKFSDTNYDSRVIAIHARILYTTEQLNAFYAALTDESWECLTSILAQNLATADLKIPNLRQIEQVEKEISAGSA